MALSIVDEPVIAAGGVRDLDDIARLSQIEVDGKTIAGVVVGREVTAGRFTIEQCVSALAATGAVRGPWSRSELDTALVQYREATGDEAADAAGRFVQWLASGGGE